MQFEKRAKTLTDEKSLEPTGLGEAKRIWKEFKWTPPEGGSNKEIIQKCLENIEADHPKFGIDAQVFLQSLVRKRQLVLQEYRKIFPKQNQKEPFYHNISEDESWNDHVGYVMASSVRIFLGMMRIKEAVKSNSAHIPDNLRAIFSNAFGDNWQDLDIKPTHLNQLLSMSLAHEVGEWWVREVWSEDLEAQKKQVVAWQTGQRDVDEIESVNEISKKHKKRNIFRYFRKVGKTVTIAQGFRRIFHNDGLKVVFNYQNPTEIEVYFDGGNPEDVEFSPNNNQQINNPFLNFLTRCFKGADFSQLLSKAYLEKNSTGQAKGGLSLYIEMMNYRPNALVSAGWKNLKESGVDEFFFDHLFLPYFDDSMQLLFLASADDFKFEDLDANFQTIKKILNTNEDPLSKLTALNDFFSSIFSPQLPLQQE